ncbi:MAG: (2Fe-2S) ferredoxin domain-containing protein [Spirochaetaceae bacterium]
MRRCRVEICMGSSCHSRGNYENAKFLRELVAERDDVELVGSLCENECRGGPVVRVDGRRVHNPDPRLLRELIEDILAGAGETGGPA